MSDNPIDSPKEYLSAIEPHSPTCLAFNIDGTVK